ncbi:MAG TPA: flagellar biosynthetic protein FliO [Sedimentisphaerales bacterium]|nr:flagellar biosynthetic protein FliO [Sedimentisphaerales bacterium]
MKKTAAIVLLGTLLVLPCAVQAAAPTSPEEESIIGQHALDTSEALKTLVTSALLIIVLGAAAIYLARRIMPKVNAAMGRELKVIESIRLGPGRQVHIIGVGSRRLLIGSAAESVTYLTEVSSGQPDAARPRQETAKNE